MTDQELSAQKLAELREAATGWPVLAALVAERDRLAAQAEHVRALHDDRARECANPQHTNPSVVCPECRECCMSCGEDYPCATIRALDADA